MEPKPPSLTEKYRKRRLLADQHDEIGKITNTRWCYHQFLSFKLTRLSIYRTIHYLKQGSGAMDATDIAIINELKDGRISFKTVAERLHLAEGTVRSRVRKLRQEGVLDIAGLVDPEALPEHSVVMIGVRLKDMDLVKKAEEFSRLRGVISVSVVTGRFDLLLTVMISKDFGILQFYTQEVSGIDKVQSVETFVIYKSFNLKVPLPQWGPVNREKTT